MVTLMSIIHAGLSDSERDKLQRQLELKKKTNIKVFMDDPYRVDELNPWELFVKYCQSMEERPEPFGDHRVFRGWLHDCDTVTQTQMCARPIRDRDNWEQWCFGFGNILFERNCKVFFFEFDIPDWIEHFTVDQCDVAISAELNSRAPFGIQRPDAVRTQGPPTGTAADTSPVPVLHVNSDLAPQQAAPTACSSEPPSFAGTPDLEHPVC